MFLRRKIAIPLTVLFVSAFLLSTPAFGHRQVGTRASSDYGTPGGQSFWELQPVAQVTINGITVSTESVCPGGTNPPGCFDDYLFLYQIPSGPNSLVVTFSGLSNFAFNNSANGPGFGVLLCSGGASGNMLCTQNLTAQQVGSLNLGWDAVGGDLILTVPSLPAGDTLTLFIEEGPESPGPLVPPTMNLGGAVVIPPGLNFGSQETRTTSAPQTVTVENSGDFSTTLNVTEVSAPTNFASVGTCVALTPGESCALLLSATPSTTGSLSGTLSLTDNSPEASEAIGLNGIGNTPGVTLSLSTVIFGPQPIGTNSAQISVSVANAASSPQSLKISSISASSDPVTGAPDFTETDTCTTAPIAPGSNCGVQITFAPTISGLITSSMTISDNSADGSHVISLSGDATEPKSATIDLSSLSFGKQSDGTTSTPKTVTVTNAGTTELNVVAVNTTAGFLVNTDDCSTASPLSAGATCSISVAFDPTQEGSYTGSLTVADDAVGGTLVVPLSGSGVTPPAATPTISVESGTYTSTQTVTISDSTPGAIIYYSTNGTSPTTSSQVYSSPITISSSETLEAIATANGYLTSAVAIAMYIITPPAAAPTFSPGAGTYTTVQTITISDTTPSASVYYTTDGTTPTSGSTLYASPITISSTMTVIAIATAPGYAPSGITTAQYTIDLSPPSFTITGTAVTVSPGGATGNTSMISITPSGGYTGTVSLSATITSSPSGAQDLPTVSFGSTSSVLVTGNDAVTATLTISTTPATSSALSQPKRPGNRWHRTESVVFACVLLFFIPTRHRRWQSWLRLFFLLVALAGGVLACGGGGPPPNKGNPGTTAGAYTITITGMSGSLNETGTVALTVN